jgi:glycosyltransferase involved in cell wall biosynthesis
MKISIVTVTHNRSQILQKRALPSVLSQTDHNFEWIVINDGGDIATNRLISHLSSDFPVIYRDLNHEGEGFGLAHGRNLALSLASGEVVTYLDDDNCLEPSFVAETAAFYQDNPAGCYGMTVQRRWRERWEQGQLVKKSQVFMSPTPDCEISDLITHQQLVDSNGFTHRRVSAPEWNPALKIYVDYDYLLRCVGQWDRKGFCLNSKVLVEYIQTNHGIIGQSSYAQWGRELMKILDDRSAYPMLTDSEVKVLRSLATGYLSHHEALQSIKAFS